MKLKLSKIRARALLILLAKKYNEIELHNEDSSEIDIDEIRQEHTTKRLQSKLWTVLHPAKRTHGDNRDSWDALKKNVDKYETLIDDHKYEKHHLSCTYDILNTIVLVSKGTYKKEYYTPGEDVFKRMCIYLELNFEELKEVLPNDVVLLTNSKNKFHTTSWYGYYRSRNPETLRVCIVKCCVQIDLNGNVKVNNSQSTENDGDFHNYTGKIEVNQNQLLIKLQYEDAATNDDTYIIFSIPEASRRLNNLSTIHGLYVQTLPNNYSTRGRSIIFKKSEELWENMHPTLIESTFKNKDGSPRLPFSSSYRNSDEQIKRLLFEKHQNYISTLKPNLSKEVEFGQKLVEWDLKFSTKARPIYDIYVSCPIGVFRHNEDGFNDMKQKVTALIEKIKSEIIFIDYPKGAELTIRTPFDRDKFPTHDTDVTKINPKLKSREIENSKLFIMYYPDTSIMSSCIIEASWALQVGVCSLFIVDKEDGLPRYLRKSSFIKQVPIHICEGGKLGSFQEIGSNLGRSISFRKKR